MMNCAATGMDADDDTIVEPRERPAPRRDGAGGHDQACYVASASGATLRLQVQGPVRHAADAALALQRCEALLEPLQAWAGEALDWRWAGASPHLAPASHACAAWRLDDGHPLNGLLELPWTLLRTHAAPAPQLRALLQWPALPAVLAVSQLALESNDLRQLEPGGAVVLPDSLAPDWHGRLRAAAEPAGAGVPALLSWPAPPLLAPQPPAAAARSAAHDGRHACEVRLALPHALPGDRLAGWCAGESLAGAGPQASLWRCADAGGAGQCLALGRLMPWGSGWALALETLCDVGAAAPTH